MTLVKLPIALIATFLWVGFVGAISFMESWLKFRAPGITIPLGLGIGKIVFDVLNKIEWVLAIAIFISLITSKTSIITVANAAYFIPLILLIIQTFWLLPALNARAQLVIQGATVPSSNLHFYYVGFEMIKVTLLVIFGISLFKNTAL